MPTLKYRRHRPNHAGLYVPGSVAATTTWDSANKGPNVALSGGDLIATNNDFGVQGARSVASHSSGKYFASFTINTVNGGSFVGICNATQDLTGAGTAFTNSLDATGCVVESGVVWLNGGGIESTSGAANGDTVDMAVDFTAERIWFRVNGGTWNSGGDPAAGTGGGDFSPLNAGPYYAVVGINNSRIWTANFGATAYTHAAPSGYGNW